MGNDIQPAGQRLWNLKNILKKTVTNIETVLLLKYHYLSGVSVGNCHTGYFSLRHYTHPYSSTVDLSFASLLACKQLRTVAHCPDHNGLLFLHLFFFRHSTTFSNFCFLLFLHHTLGFVPCFFRGWNFGDKAICNGRVTFTQPGIETVAPRKYMNSASCNMAYCAEGVGRCTAHSVQRVGEEGRDFR